MGKEIVCSNLENGDLFLVSDNQVYPCFQNGLELSTIFSILDVKSFDKKEKFCHLLKGRLIRWTKIRDLDASAIMVSSFFSNLGLRPKTVVRKGDYDFLVVFGFEEFSKMRNFLNLRFKSDVQIDLGDQCVIYRTKNKFNFMHDYRTLKINVKEVS